MLPFKPGPRDWLCQTAGAAAPSGGRELREANERGGHMLHKFIFEGLPVRGMLVRLTDSWQEILKRRQAAGGYPVEVMHMLGEMTAAEIGRASCRERV